MVLELRFCTIISNDGITIFHRTFVEDDLDEYLFSGFSSAMIAFSKELGDELSMIKMEKQTIFYHEATDEGFLILSVTKGYKIQEVQEKIEELHTRDSLNLLLAGSKIGLVQNENEKFERDLFEIFNVTNRGSNETILHDPGRLNDDDYVPPPVDGFNIPKSKRKVKTLEEQLNDEAEKLERFLREDDEDEEMKKFLESFD